MNLVGVASWIAMEGAARNREHQVSIIGNHDELGVPEEGLKPIEVLENVSPDFALALRLEVRVRGVLLENPEKRIGIGPEFFGELFE